MRRAAHYLAIQRYRLFPQEGCTNRWTTGPHLLECSATSHLQGSAVLTGSRVTSLGERLAG